MKIIQPIIFTLLLLSLNIKAQVSVSNSKVSKDDIVIKTVKVYDCQTTVEAGSTLKTETTKKGKGKTYTITTLKKLTKAEQISIEKDIKIKMTNFEGKASLFTKEEQPGRLFIDYWLNPKNKIPANVKIKEITRSLKCPVDINHIVASDYEENEKTKTTKQGEVKYLLKVEAEKYNEWRNPVKNTLVPDWFTHTDLIIEVYKNDGSIDYALVDKYDRDVIYELEVKNRSVNTTIDKGLTFSPLTLPLKLRYGFTKNGVKVDDQFLADANLGAYAGLRIKKLSSRKEQGKLITLPETSLRTGFFLSLSTVTLDKNNTTIGETKITGDETKSIGTLSYGFGLIINIRNLNVGLFHGWESGFGSSAQNWNYNNRSFLGIGLGYNLDNFVKQ